MWRKFLRAGSVKMRACFINLPIVRDVAQDQVIAFPTGIIYAASSVFEKFEKIDFIDLNVLLAKHHYDFNKAFNAVISQWQNKEKNYEIIALGGLITSYAYLRRVVPVLKKTFSKAKFIVGGPLVFGVEDLIMKVVRPDIVYTGDAEEGFSELIQMLQENHDLTAVDGIYFSHNGGYHKTPPRERGGGGKVFMPRYEIIPNEYMDFYLAYGNNRKNVFVNPGAFLFHVVSSRGCPFSCSFCCRTTGRRIRFRPVESVIEEICVLQHKYQARNFVFCDEIFTFNRKRVLEFCRQIIEKNIDIEWCCSARVGTLDSETVKAMKDAGCVQISFGFESGSREMLNRFQKKTSLDEAAENIYLVRKHNINIGQDFVIGYPGETQKTILDTLEFCCANNLSPSVNFITPLPGSVLFKENIENGILSESADEIEKYILRMQDNFQKDLTVNLSGMDDEQLIEFKNKMSRLRQGMAEGREPFRGFLDRMEERCHDYPLNKIYALNLALLYYELQRYQDAMTLLEALLQMDSGNEGVILFLGKSCLHVGMLDKAWDCYEELKKKSRMTGMVLDFAIELVCECVALRQRRRAVKEVKSLMRVTGNKKHVLNRVREGMKGKVQVN